MFSIGDRVRQARLAAGLSLRELAERAAPLSHNAIAKIERGEDVPRPSTLFRLAKALGVQAEYFFRPTEVSLDCPRYRKRASLSEKLQKSIEERIREQLERYMTVESAFPPGHLNQKRIKRENISINSYDDLEDVAINLRNAWGLGTDAIENLAEAMEDAGAKVLTIDADTGFDGFSCWATGTTWEADGVPVIVVSEAASWDRQRFNIGHEVGELLLDVPQALDREKAAHRFAGALLAPRDAVIAELGPRRTHLALEELLMLKREYGLSMQAWIFRALDCGVIDRTTQTSLFKELSRQGWRQKEPGGDRKSERPWRFERLVLQAAEESYITPSQAAQLLRRQPEPGCRTFTQQHLAEAANAIREAYTNDPEATEWATFLG